jgi:HD-GYP domain-containing protein (c-di-GMP phosphodiesterase class II)
MTVYRKIDSVKDIKNAAFVVYEEDAESVVKSILNAIGSGSMGCEYSLLFDNEETIEYCFNYLPDVVFIFSSGDPFCDTKFSLCRRLRERGFEGVAVLVSDNEAECGDTQYITSEGFDNYLLSTDGHKRKVDTIQWAIINRRRRNKYTIQFDHNPDFYYTVDRDGRIYDLNKGATKGLAFTPKDVVRKNINAAELGTLEFFQDIIQPLITTSNVGRAFSCTIDEVDSIYQVNTRIHNVSTIGLVATVVKTDITRTMYSRTMDILVNSITLLSERDNYTASHSSRVFYYCMHIAEEMGLTRERKFLRAMNFAALLHDIGKIGVKDSVLLKPGKLDKDEFIELASHPIKGFEMLQPYSFLRDASELVLSHHERPDGLGYPDSLANGGIPLGAAIIAVADGFDAMTSARPYRAPLSYERSVGEVRDNMGTQFNSEVGRAFLSIITPELLEGVRDASKKPLGVISKEVLDTILRD